MKKETMLIWIFILAVTNTILAQDVKQWRGPNRNGVYNETGLLQEWPKDGPPLLWSVTGLPKGNSSVIVVNKTAYLTGKNDSMDILISISDKGKIKWQTPYGRIWNGTYPESRSTPTFDDNKVYVLSGLGDIACINAEDGKIVWKLKASEKFEGSFHKWGLAESLLIIDDKVIFTPGGQKTTVVALNKMTGETIWMTESLKDNPTYGSSVVIERGGLKIIVCVTEKYISAINATNGKMLWNFDFSVYSSPELKRNNNAFTPLYDNGKIYVTSGYNHSGVMLNLSEDASKVTLQWVDSVLDIHYGGAVKVGNYIYGSNWYDNNKGNWVCLDWETGKVMYEKEWICKGAIISADGMLYCYEEKKGNIGIAKATPENFEIISSFKIPLGTGPHWSHPVINKGILFIRHGEALMAYDVKKK
jgi:outer membrane protein assembly factor BamB